MKQVSLLVFCLVAVSMAAEPLKLFHYSENVKLLKYENEILGTPGHKYSYQLSDGTVQEQEGHLRNAGRDGEIYAVKGRYAWVGPTGVKYTVTYVADEKGYQPKFEKISSTISGVSPIFLASILG